MTDAIKPAEVAERLEKLAKTYAGQSLTSQLHSEAHAYSSRSQLMNAAASLIRSLNERVERLEVPFEKLLAEYERALTGWGVTNGTACTRAARVALERK